MSPTLTAAEYRRHIATFYGVFAAVEPALAACPGVPAAFDLGARRREPLLRADLAALGLGAADIAALPRAAAPAALASAAGAVGAMYVTEGSRLGGQVISRHVTARLGITPENGLAFFSGGETARLWRDYLRELDAFARTADAGHIVRGAVETFACFEAWLTRAG